MQNVQDFKNRTFRFTLLRRRKRQQNAATTAESGHKSAKNTRKLVYSRKISKNSNENVIDRVIFGGPHLEHTSTKPDELQPPVYAIGIGRLQKGISVQISTLFHTSNQIDAGKFYGLDEHYQLVPIENRKEAVLIGIDQRLGLIIQQNLPQIALL